MYNIINCNEYFTFERKKMGDMYIKKNYFRKVWY